MGDEIPGHPQQKVKSQKVEGQEPLCLGGAFAGVAEANAPFLGKRIPSQFLFS